MKWIKLPVPEFQLRDDVEFPSYGVVLSKSALKFYMRIMAGIEDFEE